MADTPSRPGAARDLIVVGGSAGGVDALTALVAGLPPDLPAAVCVVVHRPPYLPSQLPQLLGRAGPLPARVAVHGEPLRPGTIHVAAPDHHLLIERAAGGAGAVIRLTKGPRENRSRPAVDPLFRSAALACGPRVVAVVLSGALDDGTAGLWAVRDRGGLAVVQDPADALVTGMPASALAEVGADEVAPAAELGALLGRLVRGPAGAVRASSADDAAQLAREVAMAALDDTAHDRPERYGRPSRFSCPECMGTLWDVGNGRGPLRLRCSTGHAYSPAGLAEAQTEQAEQALWAALRVLEDKAELARVRAVGATARSGSWLAARYQAQADATQAQAAAVRALLRSDGRVGLHAGAQTDVQAGVPSGASAGARGHSADPVSEFITRDSATA
jgi:two-component system chemotaxis response regulator CheB